MDRPIEPKAAGVKLALTKSVHLEDWYLIERAEHDGKEGFVRTGYGMAFTTSARFSDADVEGTAEEMLGIADAIKQGGDRCKSFKRCAVRLEGDRAFFQSPRNSTREGETSRAEAERLADAILKELGR